MVKQVIVFLLLFIPSPLLAWSQQSQVNIGWEAARLGPPDLFRQIRRHKLSFRDGLVVPFADPDRIRHEKNADGTGQLDRVIEDEVHRAVAAIRNHRPFEQIVYQLGILLHYLNEANNPLFTSADDPSESAYAGDYIRYIESAEPRFSTLFYGVDERLSGPDSVSAFIERTLGRSRRLYPFIGREYRRVGGKSGVHAFDDRSTAFGVAAVSFSRAMSDGVMMLRYVWLEAGGADPLRRFRLQDDHLVKVARPH